VTKRTVLTLSTLLALAFGVQAQPSPTSIPRPRARDAAYGGVSWLGDASVKAQSVALPLSAPRCAGSLACQ
jgi:hypothetical protein